MYNIGMIGTGFITDNFIESTNYVKEAIPYAIVSRSIETAERFKQKHNLSIAYDDYAAMLNDKNISIIYIASPNGLHFDHAKQAINSGKHCLIEKPIALLPEEIEELYKLAKKRKVFIMEAYVSLTYNTFEKVAEWITTLGEIGKVDFHLDQQTRHFNDYLDGKHLNVFDNKMGGGALRDLGAYCIYPLISWFGNPMQSHYFSTKNETGADETTLVLCHYETFSATVHVSKMLSDRRSNIITGDNGYIELDHINEMKEIKLYNPKGELVESLTAQYENRMVPQLVHFVSQLESNKLVSDTYTKLLATQVHSIISGNYK